MNCFGDQYRQQNAAFNTGCYTALDKPCITLHGEGVVRPFKEVDAAAQVWQTTTDQIVETLRHVLKA